MTYFINKYDGTQIAAIAEGSMDTTSTSLKLCGRNFVNYGEAMDENLVNLLENFAGPNPPTGGLLAGQLWYKTTDFKLYVFNGTQWVLATTINVGNTNGNPNTHPNGPNALPPSGSTEGELYWDEDTQQLWAWTTVGTDRWVLIGPAAPDTTNTRLDYQSIDGNNVLVITVSGNALAIWSATQFSPTAAPWSTNFPTVYAGLTYRRNDLNDTVSGRHMPTVTDTFDLGTSSRRWNNIYGKTIYCDNLATTAGGGSSPVPFYKFFRSDRSNIPDLTNTYDLGTPTVRFRTVYAQTVVADSLASTTTGSIAFDRFMRTDQHNVPTATNSYNLGSAGATFAAMYATNFYGTAVSAKYADVAERYHADQPMEAGDLVSIGGEFEITKTTGANDIDVFGVISANPAVRMNAEAGDDTTHPFVALAGRIPCKVVGKVRKGQRLVASEIPGVARAYENLSSNPFSVFGRALADKDTDDVALVEVVVGAK